MSNFSNLGQLIQDLKDFKKSDLYRAIAEARTEQWIELAQQGGSPDVSWDDSLKKNAVRGAAEMLREDVVDQTIVYLERLKRAQDRKEQEQQEQQRKEQANASNSSTDNSNAAPGSGGGA